MTEKGLAGWDLVGLDPVGWDLVGHNHFAEFAVCRIGFGKDPAGQRLDRHTVVLLGIEMGPVGRRSDRRTVVAVRRIETFSLRVVIGVSNDEQVNYGKWIFCEIMFSWVKGGPRNPWCMRHKYSKARRNMAGESSINPVGSMRLYRIIETTGIIRLIVASG